MLFLALIQIAALEDAVTNNNNSLLLRIAAGDESAFREFFHEYSNNIYTVAFMLTKSAEMAEDMVQEIFLKLWLNRVALADVHNIRSYIFIHARNHIFNELRKKADKQEFTDELLDYFSEVRDTPENALLQKESRQLLHKAIQHLPMQQQLVYKLSRDENLTQEEIAARLGISKHTVRNHMAQALQNIRYFLESNANGLLLLICIAELLS
ncbi:RNA polymerase sigma factor [Chitinophaga sp. sic0106]|uniref:RNA polymerase sigma factor n=1 Tax=Chitinophaga sp. sic0106 TaxID=2854785 RepID=UPI001C4485D2|nr:RNA polymerase sigma-70 factor [Chitinophaga sp. sic0106]MBV7532557.1 RNA polymerase sigma-70 factor [Chitinophaga sp. sic0106]